MNTEHAALALTVKVAPYKGGSQGQHLYAVPVPSAVGYRENADDKAKNWFCTTISV